MPGPEAPCLSFGLPAASCHSAGPIDHAAPAAIRAKLLTFHGTIVRRSLTTNGLTQAALLASPSDISDASSEELTLEAVSFGEPGHPAWVVRSHGSSCGILTAEAGMTPATVHLKCGEAYVCAEPNRRALLADRQSPAAWETFLPVSEDELSLLRHLGMYVWYRLEPVQALQDRPAAWLSDLRPQFRLQVGDISLNLLSARPHLPTGTMAPDAALGESSVVLLPCGEMLAPPVAVRRGPARARPREVALRLAASCQTTPAATRHDGLAPADDPPTDCLIPPLVVCQSDAEFFFRRYSNGVPRLGEVQASCRIRRMSDAYILLQRDFEGIVFDQSGTYWQSGYGLENRTSYPDGLRLDCETVKVNQSLLADAPALKGSYIICCNPSLANYYHWLVESLLSLDVIRHDSPGDSTLLLPGTLAAFRANPTNGFNHRHMVELLGLDTPATIEVAAPICRVEEAVWLEDYGIDVIPGTVVRRFRDRIAKRFGDGRPRQRRIYIERRGSRSLQNAEEVAAFAHENGFTPYRLEELAEAEQISLFQQAAFVMAPHGAGLSNLVFCAEGTKVIEFMPDVSFRPWFWFLSQKLGHHHAILPSKSLHSHFDSPMRVDLLKLTSLFRMVEAYL